MAQNFILILVLMALLPGISNGQNNLWDGFTPFQSGSGGRNIALGKTNGGGTSTELSNWSVNPAQIHSLSWSNMALHSSFYPAGIRSFSLMGLVSRDSIWPIAAGLSMTSFGTTPRYDEDGNALGEFKAAVSQFSIGTARRIGEEWMLGVTMNYGWRTIDHYSSHVLHFGIGTVYQPNDQLGLGLSLTNLGYELLPFDEERFDLPVDLSLYMERELNYLPFTFFVKMQKLNLWNRMVYSNPFKFSDQNLNKDEEISSRLGEFVQEFFRHLVVGGEFAFGKPEKLWLRFSYDHWRNQQLGIPGIRSLEGVALGFGIQLKPFRLDYAWERLYFDSGSHQISLAFRLFEKDRRAKGF